MFETTRPVQDFVPNTVGELAVYPGGEVILGQLSLLDEANKDLEGDGHPVGQALVDAANQLLKERRELGREIALTRYGAMREAGHANDACSEGPARVRAYLTSEDGLEAARRMQDEGESRIVELGHTDEGMPYVDFKNTYFTTLRLGVQICGVDGESVYAGIAAHYVRIEASTEPPALWQNTGYNWDGELRN